MALQDASLTATLSISTLDDQVFEADGSIEVVVLSPPATPLVGQFTYEVSSPGSASVTVEDNDPPTVSISNGSASEDAGTMDFTVSVPAAYGRMTVDWETSDGNGDDAATAGSDYEAASGQVAFSEGEPTRTISVNITDDSDAEGDETFILTLKDPVGLALPADPTATGTIVDDEAGGPGAGEIPADDAEVTITATESSVEEGEEASFTITRRQQTGGTQSDSWSDAPLSVNLALSQEGDFFSPSAENFGGAFRSYDADSATAIVIIMAGQESAALNLTTDDDDVAEVDGAVTLTLAGGTGYAAGSPSIATTSVTDNDLGISISDAAKGEEKSEITFTVSLSRAAGKVVTVVASTRDGDATSTADVTATSLGKDFEQKTGTLTFDAGDTEKEFAVTLVNDTIDEHDEEFTVVLSAPSDNAGLLDASATGAIEDDDAPMMVGVHREGRTVNEDAEGPVIFRFEAAPNADSTTTATERTIEVRWTVLPGTAKAGDDYAAVAASEKTEIPVGVTTRSVEVDLVDDSVFEVLEETFTFQLQNAVNAVENTDHRSIEMSIRDDDGMRADMVPVSQVVAEGDDAVFRVQLTQSVSSAPVEITYFVVGTAGPLDYVAPSGSLAIPAGESMGFITISTLADNVVDPGETLGVVLKRATSNEREVITPEEGQVVTVLDSNTLSASIASSTPGNEGDDVEFTVRLSFAFDGTVRVDWETEDVKGQGAQATSGADYTSSSGTVVIAAGDTSATFKVATLEDSLFEGDEVFGAKLTGAVRVSSGDARTEVPLGVSSIVATITDDDAQPTAITLTAAPASVNEEDGEKEFTVTGALTGPSRLTGDVEISLKVEGSVVVNEDTDETETPTLTISAGQASGTAKISAAPIDDEIDDDSARIRITGSADGFEVTQAIVTIVDNDEPAGDVTLTLSQDTVGEGAGETELTVTGTLNVGAVRTEETEITLSVEGVSIPAEIEGEPPSVAASESDFTAPGVTLTIPAGQRSGTATVTITPEDDNLAEGPETARVSGESDDLDVTPAHLTIEDNDQDASGIRLSVSPASVTEKDGTEEVEVTATLTGGGARAVQTTVDLAVADVTATAGVDYRATSTELVIQAGQMSGAANMSITLIDNELHEPTEQVAIRGTNDDPGLQVRGARLSIIDDDAAPTGITLSVDRSSVLEGGGFQTVAVTAQMQGNSRSTDTVVSLSTVSGTAIRGSRHDFYASYTTLVIPAEAKTSVTPMLIAPVDDQVDEGDETLSIRGSASLRSLNVQSATITITDDDTAGVAITPNALTIDEGGSGSYRVALQTQPTETVTVTVTGQAGAGLTLDKTTLTFTTSNWGTPQAVTVTAGPDTDGTDDSATLTHTAAGGEYQDLSADLAVTVVDNDRAIVLTPSSLTVDEEDATGETYTVKLESQPSETVTVTVSGQAGTDLTLTGLSATNTLTFTTDNWDAAQTVTVKAGDDADGADDKVTLTHTVAGGNYEDVTADLAVTVDDDETVSVVLSETSLSVTEEDATGETYTVKLSNLPSQQVTVTVTGQAGTELTLDKTTLTFTTANWNTAQTVTVKATGDTDGDDDPVTLTHTAAGGEYEDVSADLAVTVVDNDRAIVLSPSSLEVEEEDPTGATYTVKLATEPSQTVTITIAGQAGTEVSVDDAELTFTTDNWDTVQTVTVKAGGDTDGADDRVTLTHTAAGGNYADVTAELAVTVDDDETLSVVLSETALSVTEEDTSGETYTVKLSNLPSQQVTVTITGQTGTDLTLDKTTLTFTTANWDTVQTVTVKATGDTDGADDPVTLTHTAAGGEYDSVTATLAVTVVDDDRAIVLTPSSLTVEEEDPTGETYTVKLATEPSEEVTVTITGQSGTEVSVDDAELTFTTDNWDTAQTVTVKAAGDTDGADDKVTLTHTAAGGNYADVTAELAVTVDDDETLSVVLSETTLSVTEEDATGETYTVKLSHQPSQQVTVTVTGQSGTELTLDKTTLTFTTSNWDTAQSVTVKAGHDTDGADDSVTLTHTAAGGEYDSVTADLSVTVLDNDRAIVLSPSSLAVDEEDAAGETYTVKLATEPSEEVTVTITGQSGTEVSVDDAGLTFTTSNWDTAQTVTVKAAGDTDGANDEVTLTHTAAGGNYADVTEGLAVTVDDDETVSVVLSETTLSVTEEDATGETYTVKLSHQPSEQVTVTVTGQSGTDLTLDKTTLTFTTSNWDTTQSVTVKATNDTDGADDPVTLTHTAAGGEYDSVAATLAVTVVDNDRAIVLTPTSLTVEEEDATGETYTVKLATEPSEEVTVTITGQSGTEVTLDKTTLTFTTSNWDTAQTVTVKATDDADGANDKVTLTHTAAGGNYEGVTADLAVTVNDNETVSVVLSKTSLSVTEEDATGSSYTVKLSHQPSQQVTVTVTGQSGTELTLDKTTLTFTTSNWDTAQTVTVKAGDDDDGADDPVTLTHSAAGGEYASVTATLPVTVVDNDRAIVLTPSSLTVDEEDAAGETYTVKLATEPSEEVTVTVTGQSGTEVSVDDAELTFTTGDWDTAQTVTVKAGSDTDGADDKVTLTHTAAGGNYADVTADLAVTVDDDETVSVVLSKTSLSVTEEDATGETYTVKLSHQPSEQVTVTVTGQAGTEVTLSGLSATNTVTFTTANWNTAQPVTVKAGHDTDGTDDSVTLTHAAAGGEYDSVTADLAVTVLDNDRAIVLTPTSLEVDEEDATGETYTAKLATEPSAGVTVTITGQSGTEVSVDDAELTFSTSNWNTAQTVTVKATDDADGANDKVTLTHTAAGGNYEGVTADLAVTVDDDETVAVVLSETSLSVTEEEATGETYTVKLSHQSSEQVTVTVTGQSGTELTLDKNTLTFTTSNWDTTQSVTVKATNDTDGADDPVTLTHTAAGGEYASVTADLAVTVVDNDRAIVLSPSSLTVEEEDATGETYTVKLATEPSAGVTVTITGQSGTEVTLDKTTLTFTTSNWNTAQTVTVKATDDADGANDKVTLTHTAAGGNYEGVTADLAVTVNDNETVAVVLSKSSLSVTEEGATGETYTVKLSHQPSEQVTVTVTGQSGTDLTLDKTTLTFTTSNWDTTQSVTVKATNDTDGADDPVTLTHTASGGEYDSVAATLAVTVVDNDRAIVLTPSYLTVEEEDATGETYTVKLATEPSEEVTVTVTGQSGTDLTLDKTSLTFTTDTWNAAQTVTVTAGHDTDGADDSETLTHTAAGGNYEGVTADLAVTVDDDGESLQTSATISFANTSVSIPEGAMTTVTVRLSQSLSEAITVVLTRTNQSGATNADYSGVPESLEFASGETSKSFTFVAETDSVDESDEVVVIGFGALPEGLEAGSDDEATVTIRDATPISISFDSGAYSATEGGSDAMVTVELSTAPAQQVEITLTETGRDGATSDDWTGVPSSLTFAAGDTSQSFTVTAVDDEVEDDGEMVELGFGALPEGIVAGANATARVTLMNDDRQEQEESDTESPVTSCDDADADRYWEEDVEVDNNGQELPDQANNADGHVSLLQVGQTLEGYIGPCHDWDMFSFELEEDKYYRIDFLGSSTLDGTLSYPNLLAFFTDGSESHYYRTEAEPVWYRHSDGKRPYSVIHDNKHLRDTVWVDPGTERQDNWAPMTEGNYRGGVGSNAREYLMHFPAGTYYVVLVGNPYSIGTYRIRLTEVSDDDSGIRTLTLGDETTGSLDFVGDKDVFDLELVAGKTYDISIQKTGPWQNSAPFVGRVEDVDASTETNFPFTRVTEMRHFTFYAATTGNHRFTVQGYRVADIFFADGEYGLTVTEHVFAPSAPRNLTVSSLTHDSVTLTWEAPEDSVVESYQVLRRFLDDQEFGDHHGSTKFVVIADDISSAETTYTDTSVEPRTRYVYRVKVRNAGGLGEMSSYANAVTLSDNRAATGVPIITGPPTVGRTLTADTTGIEDSNGLEDVSFSYQWLADDADISGATGNRYTLTDSEEGKAIKVRVSFTDDEENEESLTSAATAAVSAAVSAAVPGVPRSVGVERGGTGELDVSWEEPSSSGGSSITGYTVQWKEASGSWDTAADVSEATVTVTSYTITGLRLQVEYAVRVFATNSAGDGPASAEVKETADAQTSQQQEASENTPATGAPAISGILEVGQSLNADTSSISDDDGLTTPAYVYQWLSDDTDISGDTESAYILADSDQGKAIRVRVSFTDDAGNEETLTSEALEVPVRPHGLTAAVSDGAVVLTWNPPVGFSYLYDYQILRNRPELGEAEPLVYVNTGNAETTYTDTDVEPGVLYVYRVKAASYFARFTEASGPVEIRTAEAAANTPATGAPAISGDLVVGQTLSVDTSAIEDDDGLTNPAFVYQWLADNTDISGATASSYTLVDSDEGKAIKVTVSFTDDAGNGESLSSAATASVAAAATPLTAEFLDTPSSHDGDTAFTFELRFSEEPKSDFSYTTLRDHAFTVTGGEVTTARRLEEPSNIRWEITVAPDGNGSVTVVLPATTDCTAQGAICTGDGKMLSGEVTVTVGGPEGEEQQTPPENTPATGAPTISGTARVGETLTADTSGIADSDGTDKAAFAYQWLADDTDISGATASSYTLVDSDEGKAIKVRVSFTDDAGNAESLTSSATAAVAAAPAPLTAEFLDTPSSHDGQTAFTFELRFSEEFELSYVILRDHAMTVTGAEVTRARRLDRDSTTPNIRWEITVAPDGNGDVTVVLPMTSNCEAQAAICTGDGRMLSTRVELTAAGPGG